MPTTHHASPRPTRLEGTFRAPLYSPEGALEGAMLDTRDGPVEVVFDPHDADAALLFTDAHEGAAIALGVTPEPHADERGHAVFRLDPVPSAASRTTHYAGVVAHVHFARHDEPNGVVLDTGTFLHMKPDGMRAHALAVGDAVTATAPSRPRVSGRGVVVEVETINGAKLRPKPRH